MTGIHLIILKDGIYKVKEPGHEINPMFDFFDACDIFRNALATYQDEINRWIMNDGSGFFFGCIHLP